MIVRKALVEDIPEILKLAGFLVNSTKTEHWTEDAAYLEQEEKKPDYLENLKEFFLKKIHSENALLLVCETEGKLVGYSLCYIAKEMPIYVIDKTGYLSDLYILPEYRGKGISTKFKDAAFDWFKKKGITHASVKTRIVNKKSKEIYKHWGFFEYSVSFRKKI